jgi:hypothetical protein
MVTPYINRIEGLTYLLIVFMYVSKIGVTGIVFHYSIGVAKTVTYKASCGIAKTMMAHKSGLFVYYAFLQAYQTS